MPSPKWWAKDHKALLIAALRSHSRHAPRQGLSGLAWSVVECAALDAAYRRPANFCTWEDYIILWPESCMEEWRLYPYEEAIRAEAWLRGFDSHRQDTTCESLLKLAGLENTRAGEMFAELAYQERAINALQRFDPQI